MAQKKEIVGKVRKETNPTKNMGVCYFSANTMERKRKYDMGVGLFYGHKWTTKSSNKYKKDWKPWAKRDYTVVVLKKKIYALNSQTFTCPNWMEKKKKRENTIPTLTRAKLKEKKNIWKPI